MQATVINQAKYDRIIQPLYELAREMKNVLYISQAEVDALCDREFWSACHLMGELNISLVTVEYPLNPLQCCLAQWELSQKTYRECVEIFEPWVSYAINAKQLRNSTPAFSDNFEM